jgi:hypothetical protein
MSTFYIYEHWRPDANACFYVGKGRGGRARDMGHRSSSHKSIQRELRRVGLFVDVRITACDLTESSAFETERTTISARRADGSPLVNMTAGGQGTSGHKHSPETRARIVAIAAARPPEHGAKISAAKRGCKFTAEHRAKISAANRRRTASPETRAKLAAVWRGRHHSPEARAKLSEALRGHPVSEASRQKMAARARGRQQSAETVAKRAASNRGKKRSPEARARMAAAQRRYQESHK